MQRYSFATFRVDQSNREAFEVCRAVAELRPVAPMPVLLLGDDGCGKTHLLYSVVNQIRSGSARTGLAYVTAREFPDKVRGLIKDPTPVQRAASAILMVDQLEKFTSLIEELEAVIRIFLDNGHYVLVASSVHPGRLRDLPRGLANLISGGQVIRIEGAPADEVAEVPEPVFAPRPERPARVPEIPRASGSTEVDLARILQEADAASARAAALESELQQERDGHARLRLEVDTLKQEFSSARAAAEAVRRDFDALRKEHEALQRDYDTVQTGNEILHRDNDSLRRDTDKTRQERESFLRDSEQMRRSLEAAQQQLAVQRKEYETLAGQFEVARAEAFTVAELRGEVARLQDEFERLDGERNALTDRLDRMQELEDELEALRRAETELRRQLSAARDESEAKQRETDQLVARAESVLLHVEEQRTRFDENEERQREQVRALELQLAQQTGAAASVRELEESIRERESLRAELEEAKREWAVTREQLAVALRAAQNETANQDESRKAALDKISRLTAEYAAMQLEVADAREKLRALAELQAKLSATEEQLLGLPALQEELDTVRGRAAKLEEAEQELDDTQQQLSLAQVEIAKTRAETEERNAALEQARQTAAQLETDVAHALDQAAALEKELAEAREEGQRLEGELDRAKLQLEELDRLRIELAEMQETLRKDSIRHTAEMDALRLEAMAQVAAANAQAGDVEREYAKLCSVMDFSRQTGRVVSSELRGVQEQLVEAAAALEKLTGQLTKATEAETTGLANAPAPREEDDFLDAVKDMNLPGLDDQVFFEAPSEPDVSAAE